MDIIKSLQYGQTAKGLEKNLNFSAQAQEVCRKDSESGQPVQAHLQGFCSPNKKIPGFTLEKTRQGCQHQRAENLPPSQRVQQADALEDRIRLDAQNDHSEPETSQQLLQCAALLQQAGQRCLQPQHHGGGVLDSKLRGLEIEIRHCCLSLNESDRRNPFLKPQF